MFHGTIDSLNHFTDSAKAFLEEKGCETLICLLPITKQGEQSLNEFIRRGIHAVIMYDGIGMYLRKVFDQFGIPVINILMDHPMTLWECMAIPPRKYIQFSPDETHVEFSKKYWNIKQSFFLPHMGTAPAVCGGKRTIELLFPASYAPPDRWLDNIRGESTERGLKSTFLEMIDYMKMKSTATIEAACCDVIKSRGISPSLKQIAIILTQAKAVDVYIRMYHRERAVRTILDHGMDITVIGGGWDRSDLIDHPGFHWIPSVPFADVFQYMRRSKIVLNVMPWFKSGTHDRIFNTLLSGACPISDKSTWLEREFKDKKEIAYYDLDEIEHLPEQIDELLHNDGLREEIVRRGQEKVVRQYTTANVIGEALQNVINIYYLNQ